MLASSTISTTSSLIVAGLAVAVAVVLVLLLLLNRRDRRRLAATTEQLAASEARMRRLAETVPAGIFQTDAQGKRLYVNPRLVDITGDTSTKDALDRPWLIHEDDEQQVRDDWARAHEQQASYQSRFRIRRSSGEIRWVAVEVRPIVSDATVTGWAGSVVDVTEETQAIGELRRFNEILEATPDLVAMVDTHGGFTYANAAARTRFGIADDDQMRQMGAIDVYAPSSRALFFGEALPTANRIGGWAGEVELLLPDGSEVPVSQVVVAHRRPDGSVDYYSSITRDVSERRVLEEQLAQAGLYDALTGLPNRAVLQTVLGDALDTALQNGTQLAALLLDLDHFRLVNDSFGHDSGDLVLRLVTQRLQSLLAPGDLLARLGGDVFCLVSTAVSGEGGAVAAAEQVTETMAAPFHLDGDQVFLSMSIGIALSE